MEQTNLVSKSNLTYKALTRLASSLNGRHSPKAFKRVVIFFFGSGLDKAKIIGLWGFVRNRMTCQRMLAMRQR